MNPDSDIGVQRILVVTDDFHYENVEDQSSFALTVI